MSKYTNSYGVTINFTPWFDTGYTFTRLHMYEELGGKIPGGEIDLEHDGSQAALDLITKQTTGTITLEKVGGNIYTIDIFVTGKKFYKNFLTLEFTCIKDKKFYTDLVTSNWTDIDSAINSLYPGNIDIRCSSDINNGITILQNSESNYSLCTKLAYCYKHNTVFAYGWEGLMIKETIGIDSTGNNEPYWKITGNTQLHQTDSYIQKYNQRLYKTPKNPWEQTDDGEDAGYSNLQAKNCRVVQNYNDYQIVSTDYYQMLDNYWFNTRYMKTNLFTEFKVVDIDMPRYKIGDVLKYNRDEQEAELPFTLFLVRSNELFFAIEGSSVVSSNGSNFSWTSRFIGLQENGSTLPEEDPTDQNNNSNSNS